MKNALALAVIAGSAALTQTPAFEVAVVKPAAQEQVLAAVQAGQRPHVGVTIDKNRMDMGFQSLSDILARAYDVSPSQIVGPDFLKTEHFDILAKLPAGATEEQVPQMLRALLADRFKVAVRREQKEQPIYALVVSKGGLNPKRMKPATAEEMAPEPQPGDRTESTPFGKAIVRQTANNGAVVFIPGIGTTKMSAGPSGEHAEMSNLTTARFARMLMQGSDRVVVDKTGLKGSYEVAIDASRDTSPMPAPGANAGGAVAAASIQPPNPMFLVVDQLGLKIEPQKDLVEMLVIDHIEKTPTDN